MSPEATPASLARALTAVSPNPPVEKRTSEDSRIRLRVSSHTAPCGRPGRRLRDAVRGRVVTPHPPGLVQACEEYRMFGSNGEGGGIRQQCDPSSSPRYEAFWTRRSESTRRWPNPGKSYRIAWPCTDPGFREHLDMRLFVSSGQIPYIDRRDQHRRCTSCQCSGAIFSRGIGPHR